MGSWIQEWLRCRKRGVVFHGKTSEWALCRIRLLTMQKTATGSSRAMCVVVLCGQTGAIRTAPPENEFSLFRASLGKFPAYRTLPYLPTRTTLSRARTTWGLGDRV